VADFVTVVLEDGTEVMFQSAEADLVRPYGGTPAVERYEAGMASLAAVADAAGGVSRSFREKVKPEELRLEIGVGLSGEVGWFFAKSGLEASIKLTLTWRAAQPSVPGTGSRPPDGC
jgi:hypothetical protein